MSNYKYIRVEKYTVTKIFKVKDMSREEKEHKCENMLQNREYVYNTMVGNMMYPHFQVDTEECWEKQSVSDAGNNDGL